MSLHLVAGNKFGFSFFGFIPEFAKNYLNKKLVIYGDCKGCLEHNLFRYIHKSFRERIDKSDIFALSSDLISNLIQTIKLLTPCFQIVYPLVDNNCEDLIKHNFEIKFMIFFYILLKNIEYLIDTLTP